jgi:predicted PurR-regulated permease PerM
MNQIPNNVLRQIFLVSVIILLGIVLFSQLKTFLPAFLGAYTLYVLMRKYMLIMETRYRWKKALSAALLMFLSFLIILLPIFTIINMMSSKLGFAVQHASEVLTKIQGLIEQYEQKYKINIMTSSNMDKLTNWGAQTLPQILGATVSTVVSIIVMYFILFFMLTEGRKMEAAFYKWMPLKTENVLMLREDTNKLVLSNAIGIPLIALAQGVVGLIGYLIIGVPEPLFWFVITSIAGMLPVLGASLAYVPLSLLLFATGQPVKGALVLVFGLAIIGTTDNIFRFWLQKKIGDVHPLITVFGVIVGVNLFGFIGLIFGPILISLFVLLLKVYRNEFGVAGTDVDRNNTA